MTNVLSFNCEYSFGEAPMLTPCIDGESLVDLATAFERSSGYNDPAGGYSGVVPDHFEFGPLSSYFLGHEEPVAGGKQGEIYALFCECANAGCWPLIVHVRVTGANVIWEHFVQPWRPKRDYSGLGPFKFNKPEYNQVVVNAADFCR